jgi:5-methylcytosine-specific restriction endonuclease McrA
MLASSIKKYLRPPKISGRKGTLVSTLSSAIAPHDDYDEALVRRLLKTLGQDSDRPLFCAYCGQQATTWDHVYPTVSKREFTGAGHRIRNLVPCCSLCNSRKGNKDWREFLDALELKTPVRNRRKRQISAYIKGCKKEATKRWRDLPEFKALQATRDEILKLMELGDRQAAAVRKKLHGGAREKRR